MGRHEARQDRRKTEEARKQGKKARKKGERGGGESVCLCRKGGGDAEKTEGDIADILKMGG